MEEVKFPMIVVDIESGIWPDQTPYWTITLEGLPKPKHPPFVQPNSRLYITVTQQPVQKVGGVVMFANTSSF